MEYFKFDEKDVEGYIRKMDFFEKNTVLDVKEIGTGNINYVFRIQDDLSNKSIILKQAVPNAENIRESFPMSLDRMTIEAKALEIQNKYAFGTVPKIYHLDRNMSLLIMEDMKDYEILRNGMIEMKKYPNLIEDISNFISKMAFFTSNLYSDSKVKRKLVGEFTNENSIKIIEDLIFTYPFSKNDYNKINPEILSYLENDFWKNEEMMLEVSKLKYKFMNEYQSLVHGDLHTGSIFVNSNSTKVFDAEFSFYGPSAFDLGLLAAHFFLNYFSWSGKDITREKIVDYRIYLLESINELFDKFFDKFSKLWDENEVNISAKVPGYKKNYINNLFKDSISFAGIVIIRRIHGLSHVEDIDGIKDEKKRKIPQLQALKFSQELIVKRNEYMSIGELTNKLKEFVF